MKNPNSIRSLIVKVHHTRENTVVNFPVGTLSGDVSYHLSIPGYLGYEEILSALDELASDPENIPELSEFYTQAIAYLDNCEITE